MRKYKKHKLLLSSIIILYILRIASCNSYFEAFSYRSCHCHQSNSIYNILKDYSIIDSNLNSGKTWYFQSTLIVSVGVKPQNILLALTLIFLALCMGIIMAKKLKALDSVRFNGSKYKGGCLLPII